MTELFVHCGLDVARYTDARRTMPRPAEQREPDYADRFDGTTLFYDAFVDDTGRGVCLVAPPMAGLDAAFDLPGLTAGGMRPDDIVLHHLDRVLLLQAQFPTAVDRLEIPHAGGRLHVSPSASHCDLFAGRKVVVAKQKNNHPRWIADWVRFYARVHGFDAFLIYDNGSDAYDLFTLGQLLQAEAPEALIGLIGWDFKFGPLSSTSRSKGEKIFDSNYFVVGALQHARLRFLTRAQCVLSCDIDELIEPLGTLTLPEAAAAAQGKYIAVQGEWVENVVDEAKPFYRFTDYTRVHAVPDRRTWRMKKWVLCEPMRTHVAEIWRVHDAIGRRNDPDLSAQFLLRHFRGISGYRRPVAGQNVETVPDPRLDGLLQRVFG